MIDQASDGKEALEMVESGLTRFKIEYSLILMDCQMPILDGYQATKEIRKNINRAGVRQPLIVACTGNEDERHIAKAWRCEMDEILQKPASIDSMKELLVEVLEF